MGFVDFLISKLVGYDILKSEKELRVSLENAQREMNSLTQQKNKLQESVEGKQGQIISLSQEVAKIKGQIDSKERNLEKLAESVKTKQTEIEQLTSTLNSKAQEIDDLAEKVIKLDAQNKSKQGTIMNHVKKINALSSELENLRQKTEQYNIEHDELIQLREDSANLSSQKSELEVKVEEAKKEIDSLEKLNKALVDQVSSLEDELGNITSVKPEEIRELEAQIQRNEEIIQGKNRDIEILNSDKEDINSKFDAACKELNAVRSDRDSLLEKLSKLETQYSTLQGNYDNLFKDYSILQDRIASLEMPDNTVEIIDELEQLPVQEMLQTVKSDGLTEKETSISDADSNESLELDVETGKDINEENSESPLTQDKDEEPEPTNIKKESPTKKTKKSKEEEAIEQSGDSIVDFPVIVNDSNKQTQRTIEYVFDENNQIVYADEFFNRSAEEIAQISRKMSEAEISGNVYWTCGLCHHRVKIAHRTYNDRESLFLIHATRENYCPWLTKSTSSKDAVKEEYSLLATDDLTAEESVEEHKPKSRELKEKIYSLLTSQASEEMGISDVQMDEIIRSNVPYMRWRRPDISFVFNGRKIVIELQKKSHDLDTIVDRDVFFRLNDIQILWVFGSDSDSSYDYMRKSNYKNTMFDNHRNVFVFDKEAQQTSEKSNTLFLKCNWLDEDDSWYFRIDNSGANGKLVSICDFIFDDEYCKPYHYDANEDYFLKHPEARESYLSTKMSREELKKAIEEKWMRDVSYEDAMVQMRQRNSKATPYCVKGLWGFRFNTTVIIPPIFTVEPKNLLNGYYLVQQGDHFGIVNSFGEKTVSWDGFIQCEEMNYDSSNKRILFMLDDLWGVANLIGKVLIPATYQSIAAWTNSVYKVRKNGKWGLCSISNELLTDFIYDKIDEIINSRALATKVHPSKAWMTVSGYIDIDGKELYSSKSIQKDGLYIVETFELYGIIDENENIIIPCQYEEILPWAENLYRIRENGKWGIYNVAERIFLLKTVFDSIGDLKDGVAKTVFAKLESAIDISGKEVSQEVIQLKYGLKKTKIAGKWGVVNDRGEIIIEHRYNEIGSFRSRLIGVINDKEVIKLNLNYDYPIHITGKYLKKDGSNYYFKVASVVCVLPDGMLKQANKTIDRVLNSVGDCTSLAFGNIIRNKYLLRVVDIKGLNKKLSHGDLEDAFSNGVELTGTVLKFKSNKGMKRKMIVRFPNGKETSVPRRYFTPASLMDSIRSGQSVTLKKTGYDKENDQTIWEIIKIG